MRNESLDYLEAAIERADGIVRQAVFDFLPEGELLRMCDIRPKGLSDRSVMRALVSLEKSRCVRFFKFGHIQLVGKVSVTTD